jgi:nucleoside-diphosphate-sugar epimerase
MADTTVVIFGLGQITNLLTRSLVAGGKKVICVTDNKYNQIKNLPVTNLKVLTYKQVSNEIIDANVAIFSWNDVSKLAQENNVMLEWVESNKFSAKKSFFLSSASVYKDQFVPHTESSDILHDNKKTILENILKMITLKKNITHTNLRISNVYGIGIDYGFIGSLFNSLKSGSEVNIFKDQNIIRDYIHIDDVIFAVNELLEIDDARACLNVSTGIGNTIAQVLEIFSQNGYKFEKRATSLNALIVKPVSILDCHNLSELIDWKPSNLSQVLNKLLAITK